MKQAYIVMRPAEIRRFANQQDRDYFSKPVLVEINGDHGAAGLLNVTDHQRGHSYPTDRKCLKSPMQLTRRQRQAVGLAS